MIAYGILFSPTCGCTRVSHRWRGAGIRVVLTRPKIHAAVRVLKGSGRRLCEAPSYAERFGRTIQKQLTAVFSGSRWIEQFLDHYQTPIVPDHSRYMLNIAALRLKTVIKGIQHNTFCTVFHYSACSSFLYIPIDYEKILTSSL